LVSEYIPTAFPSLHSESRVRESQVSLSSFFLHPLCLAEGERFLLIYLICPLFSHSLTIIFLCLPNSLPKIFWGTYAPHPICARTCLILFRPPNHPPISCPIFLLLLNTFFSRPFSSSDLFEFDVSRTLSCTCSPLCPLPSSLYCFHFFFLDSCEFHYELDVPFCLPSLINLSLHSFSPHMSLFLSFCALPPFYEYSVNKPAPCLKDIFLFFPRSIYRSLGSPSLRFQVRFPSSSISSTFFS